MEKQFEKPMKWYKFVIYFQLFAVAVIEVFMAIACFSGSDVILAGLFDYDETVPRILYEIVNGLPIVLTCKGIISIFMAVLAIITRQKLACFDEQGPKLYVNLCLINAGITFLYIVIIIAMISQALGTTDGMATTIAEKVGENCTVSIVLYVLNRIYFNKRKEYFVNHGTSGIEGLKSMIQLPKKEPSVQPTSNSQDVPPVQQAFSSQDERLVQPGADSYADSAEPQPDPESEQKHGVLIGLCGPYIGAQIEMKDGETITFGRADDNNLIFASESRISRHHCMVRWDAQKQKYIFRDYSSSGSYINDQQDCLPQNLDLEVACGSKIALGNNDNVFLFQ